MLRILIFLSVLIFVPCLILAQGGPFRVSYPNVFLEAYTTGNLAVDAGVNGNVNFNTSSNNTVYFEGNDLKYIIELIRSLPPVWKNHTPFGYLGKYFGGQQINIQLQAVDPEGSTIQYQLVAGDPPPGVTVTSTGRIYGLIPDVDATYVFTVRAVDAHNKFADEVMKIVIRESDTCKRNPCRNEGKCTDGHNDHHCTCVHPFGGKNCEFNCTTHSLGVSLSVPAASRIPNAQITAYKTWSGSSSYYGYNGRLNGPGWYGTDNSSWLQIDFGNMTEVMAVVMQGISTSYYTSRYQLKYSIDGNSFIPFERTRGSVMTLGGPASTSSQTTNLPRTLVTRYLRFIPISWHGGYKPGMRVDVLGCFKY